MVVGQLVERSLRVPEVCGSNPVIGKNLYWTFKSCQLYWKDQNKEKKSGNGPFKKTNPRTFVVATIYIRVEISNFYCLIFGHFSRLSKKFKEPKNVDNSKFYCLLRHLGFEPKTFFLPKKFEKFIENFDSISFPEQCDQIGRFLKVLGDNVLAKVAQIFGDFLCYFERLQFAWKNWSSYFFG